MIVAKIHSFYRSNKAVGSHNSDAGDRDVLIESARELFGEDAVIPVSNFNTLKLKSLIKDTAKIYGVPFEEVNEMTGPLQDEVMALARDDDTEKSVFVLKHDDCMKHSTRYRAFMEKYPEVESHINTLFMQNRSVGRHAGGVIVADPSDLAANMPLISVRGDLQTPWSEGMNFRNLEENGFLKFDFLGLTLLKDVENCIRRILTKKNGAEPEFLEVKEFFDKHLSCRYVQQDDPTVWKHVYQEGRFVGVFQFTNSGARKFCTAAKPKNIEELAAITAIYRPGPLKANVHNMYVEASKDPDKIEYEHPLIKKILGATYGAIVFQEQFMLLAMELAGFTEGESDAMRKTLVKKSLDTADKKGGERAVLRKKFVDGAKRLHGLDEKKMHELFDKIEFFSLYGFNKSLYFAEEVYTYERDGSISSKKSIQDVVPGDLLLSRDEETQQDILVPVVDKHDHGVLDLVEVELDSGEKVKCTWDHKFRTVETGEMLPLWQIHQQGLSIVVNAGSLSSHSEGGCFTDLNVKEADSAKV